MARSWEYSPVRRIAMQVVMWAILAATLGLASFVSRQKQKSGSIVLGQPILVGDLMVRLPVGWHFAESRLEDALAVRGREPVGGGQRSIRAIGVTQERLSDPVVDAADYLSNNIGDSAQMQPIHFAALQCDGVVADIEKQPERDSSQEEPPPGFYACAVLPLSGGTKLAVLVSVEDIPPLTPSDRDLLRQIVETIALARAGR